jgi:Secretion system C-terminal sorting domain
MKSLISICLLLTIISNSFSQSFNVIPLPYKSHDPSIPHPTYNGNKTVLKAIARSSGLSDQFYYRWDADGDGVWDDVGGSMTEPTGKWYRAYGYNLEGWFIYPELPEDGPEKKLYSATLQVCSSLSGSDPVDPQYATYRVIYYSGFPDISDIDQADDEELEIMRAIAQENVLWGLHKTMSLNRSGIGTVDITAYISGADAFHNIGNTALFALALLNSGHLPAYPPDTYQIYNNDPYAGFTDQNNNLYNTNPYSEDLLRLLNYILNYVGSMSVDAASEIDDGTFPVPGTNDLNGYYVYTNSNGEANPHPFAVAALASSGLMGTEVQVNNLIKGKSWEFLIQQLVDYIQFLQNKGGLNTGGWYYSMVGNSVSYLTGGWVYTLETIMKNCGGVGVYVNNACKINLVNILKMYQNTDGGALYGIGNGLGSIFEATAMIFNACRMLGWDTFSDTDPELIGPAGQQITKGQARLICNNYYDYLVSHWTDAGGTAIIDPVRALWSDGNYDTDPPVRNLWNYSIFFTTQAAQKESNPISMFGTHDWHKEFLISILKNQYEESEPGELINEAYPDGSASLVLSKYFEQGASSMAANTLAIMDESKGLEAIPEASVTEVLEGCIATGFGKVSFIHSESFCSEPGRSIVDYQWLLESQTGDESEFDAYDWGSIPDGDYSGDGKAWHSSSMMGSFVYTYMHAGEYRATLRVVNDSPMPETDIEYIVVTVTESENYSPSVSAGGPYTIIEGEDLVLDGTASDANESCGDIVSSAWDLDDDGNYDDFTGASGTVPWSVIESLGLAENTAHPISLRATDEKAETTYDNTTLTITIATGIDQTSGNKGVVLYPNPVGDILTIKPDLEIPKDHKIRIIDNKGKVIIERIESGNNSDLQINVSMLSPGIYYVQISSPGFNKRLSFIKI